MFNLHHQEALRRAEAAMHAGRYAKAEAICEEVLRRSQQDVVAMHIIGAAAFERGLYDRAAQFLEQCTRLQPDDPTILFRLARARVSQGRYTDAIALFTKIIELQPDDGLAKAAKAEALERAGQHDRARRLAEAELQAGPADPHMGLVFAKLEQQAGRHEEAIEAAERQLADPRTPEFTRWQLLFVLGWSHEKRGEFDKAFDAFRRANQVFPMQTGLFDLDVYIREMTQLMEVFSHAGFRSMPRAAQQSSAPVFIVGMPRSGSTLVEQIIDAHPRAVGAGEMTAMFEAVFSLRRDVVSSNKYPHWIADLTRPVLEQGARRYLDRVATIGRGAERVIDKSLRNFEHLGLIALMLPGARVINCVRDPLDTCLSCYMQPLSPGDHAYASDLRALGTVHRLYEKVMDHWREALDIPILDVSYEDLVAEQERVSRELIDFCGLEWDDACLRFFDSGRAVRTLSYDQVRRPIYKSALRRYEKYTEHLAPLREALANPFGG